MSSPERDSAVPGVLAQMDRHTSRARMVLFGAALLEAAFLAAAILAIDWSNSTHVLVFVCAVFGYTLIALGLVALATHVSRVGLRVVAALDGRDAS